MDMATLVGVVVALVLQTLLGALVIWIVGRLNLGLSVSGFGGAILAAIVIAVVTTLVNLLLGLLLVATGIPLGTGLLGALVALIVAAVVLLISDKILPSLRVDGFLGAMMAAIAIGVVNWLIALVLVGLGMVLPGSA